MSTSTSLRYVETVCCMPAGQWVSTQWVHEALREAGYTVSKRTVERDLLKLAETFGLERKGEPRHGYRWRCGRSLAAIAHLQTQVAVARKAILRSDPFRRTA